MAHTPTPGSSATNTASGSRPRSTVIGSARGNHDLFDDASGRGVDEYRSVGADRESGGDFEFVQERQRRGGQPAGAQHYVGAGCGDGAHGSPNRHADALVCSTMGVRCRVQGAVDVEDHHLRASRSEAHLLIP
ncbi:hypothetical protein JCM12141A_03860 [Mycolicibacterium hodleri]